MTHDQAIMLAIMLAKPKSSWYAWEIGRIFREVSMPQSGLMTRYELDALALPMLEALREEGRVERPSSRWRIVRK
jgi:hypothetical protein